MAKERPPLEEMTLRQLRRVASECSISRYSRMRKSQLLTAIQEVQHSKTSLNQSHQMEAQETVEAAKFELGQEDRTGGNLADVDEGLAELPIGYGESRIVLMPRDPQWAYTYWDVPSEQKEELRRQGGQQLALRIYDVTHINQDYQSPHSIQEYPCDELAREWYLPVPVSDRDYVIDIGYRCGDGRWLVLARSARVHIPPVYPSDWIEDIFINVNFDEDLREQTIYELVPPALKASPAATPATANGIAPTVGTGENGIYDQIFGMAESTEAMRVAGSLYGSMQHAVSPEQAISSYIFPSGVGMWAVPTTSGLTMSGVGMSGSGFSGDVPMRPRQFWLIADAELIVYGATEPDANVTIGGRSIKLNPDGTFRFHMSFQDGLIDYPIKAVAADGEQTRSIHMKFHRETPSRNTNKKEDAVLEWLF
ncbi:MAG: DUF4912 domain-containing protein [Rhizonema sp. PD37]|nr:DUF4912 domain-containing protein [Rhizonema sp. PD37]